MYIEAMYAFVGQVSICMLGMHLEARYASGG